MTTTESAATTIRAPGGEYEVDEAQLAAVPPTPSGASLSTG
jgi:hypothetical protein